MDLANKQHRTKKSKYEMKFCVYLCVFIIIMPGFSRRKGSIKSWLSGHAYYYKSITKQQQKKLNLKLKYILRELLHALIKIILVKIFKNNNSFQSKHFDVCVRIR